MLKKLALMLAICGLAATATARSTVVEERIVAVREDGSIQLERSGVAALANLIYPDDRAAKWLEGKVGETMKFTVSGKDRYGRIVITGDLQQALLKQGLALAYDKKKLPDSLLKAEAVGQKKWPKSWLVDAEHASEHYDRFRIVEGTVLKTHKARDKIYVNFGEDWRQDFSVTIPKRAWRAFGSTLDDLEGKKLRVRGTIYNENGPMLMLSQPQQMEIVE